MDRSERELRLQIIETGYGRDAGWIVELRGRQVALLTEPRFEDMFWDSYRVEPLTDDPAEREELLTSSDRWQVGGFVYRNRQFGRVAENAFASWISEEGRVHMRALYLDVGEPSLWERVRLWMRSFRAAAWRA